MPNYVKTLRTKLHPTSCILTQKINKVKREQNHMQNKTIKNFKANKIKIEVDLILYLDRTIVKKQNHLISSNQEPNFVTSVKRVHSKGKDQSKTRPK